MCTFKKILFKVLLGVIIFSFAQNAEGQKYTSAPGYFEHTGLRPRDVLGLPRRDTVPINGKIDSLGTIIIRAQDSVVYYKSKWWLPVGKGTDTTSLSRRIDSLNAISNRTWDTSHVNDKLARSLDSLRRNSDSRYQKFTLKSGSLFFALGDSYTVGSGATVPTKYGWAYQYKEAMGAVMTNLGRSGGGVVEMNHQAHINMPDTLNKTAMTVLCGFNDAIRGGADPREKAKINAGFRAFIANAYLKTAVAASAVTKYGTWSNVAGTGNYPIKANDIGSGGGLAVVNVLNNDSLVWNFTGNNLVIGYINNDQTASGFTIGNFEVFIDGVSKGIYTGNNKSLNVSDSWWSNIYSPNAVVLHGLGVGAHRVRLVHNGTANIYIDYFGTLMAPGDCPPMVIGSIPQLNTAGYASHTAYLVNDSVFNVESQQIQNAIADFPGYPISYIDVNRFYDSTGVDVSDETHPNNLGHTQIATAFQQVTEGGKGIAGDPWISTTNEGTIMTSGINGHYANNGFTQLKTNTKSAFTLLNTSDLDILFGVAAFNTSNVSGYRLKMFTDGRTSINQQPGYDVAKPPTATLQAYGSFATKTRNITNTTASSDYALLPDDYLVVVANTAIAKDSINIPIADSTVEGRMYGVINNRNVDMKSVVTYRADTSASLLNYFPAATITWIQCVKNTGSTFDWYKTNSRVLGTVSSVALSMPSIFSVTGSPVITSGTLTSTLATQAANLVFAGPTTSTAAPTFRSLVANDIPSLPFSKITTGTVPIGQGGTGLTSLGTTLQQLRVNAGATALEYFTPTAPAATISILKDFYADQGNTSTTPNTYNALYTYNIGASQCTTNGDKIIAFYSGKTAANGNSKGLQFFVSGQGLTANVTSANNGSWSLRVTMIRTTVNTARVYTEFISPGLTETYEQDLTSIDFTTSMSFTLWGTSGSGVVNDVVAKMGSVKFEAAAP